MAVKVSTDAQGSSCLKVTGSMTIYTAFELKEELLRQFKANSDCPLDLSDVTEFDSAGVQLLLVLAREAKQAGRELLVGESNSAVREVLGLYRLPLLQAGAVVAGATG